MPSTSSEARRYCRACGAANPPPRPRSLPRVRGPASHRSARRHDRRALRPARHDPGLASPWVAHRRRVHADPLGPRRATDRDPRPLARPGPADRSQNGRGGRSVARVGALRAPFRRLAPRPGESRDARAVPAAAGADHPRGRAPRLRSCGGRRGPRLEPRRQLGRRSRTRPLRPRRRRPTLAPGVPREPLVGARRRGAHLRAHAAGAALPRRGARRRRDAHAHRHLVPLERAVARPAGDPDRRRSQLPRPRHLRPRARRAAALGRCAPRSGRALDPAQRGRRLLPALRLVRRSRGDRHPAQRPRELARDLGGDRARLRPAVLPLPPGPARLRGRRRRGRRRRRGAESCRSQLGVAARRARGARPCARDRRRPHPPRRVGDDRPPHALAQLRLGPGAPARDRRRAHRRTLARGRAARPRHPGLGGRRRRRAPRPRAAPAARSVPPARRGARRRRAHAARRPGAAAALVRRGARRARPALPARRRRCSRSPRAGEHPSGAAVAAGDRAGGQPGAGRRRRACAARAGLRADPRNRRRHPRARRERPVRRPP